MTPEETKRLEEQFDRFIASVKSELVELGKRLDTIEESVGMRTNSDYAQSGAAPADTAFADRPEFDFPVSGAFRPGDPI